MVGRPFTRLRIPPLQLLRQLADRSGVVAINAERKQKQLLITVSDNGKGLTDGKVGAGLGTQIIRTLIEGELRGTIHWSSPHEGGTRVAIALPL